MLIGEFEHSIDTKGRLVLPAKIKDDLGKEFIVTKGLDGCLFGYSLEEWNKFEEKLKAEWNKFEEKLKTLPLTNKITRDFVRFFLSGAVEEETDKQGRFLLPANLREYASLTKDAVIIGVGTRIEIWDKKKWDEYNSEENLSVDSIAEKMTELGILGI